MVIETECTTSICVGYLPPNLRGTDRCNLQQISKAIKKDKEDKSKNICLECTKPETNKLLT